MKKWWLNVNKQNSIKYNLLSQNELNDSESNLTFEKSIQHTNNIEENMLSDFEDMHLVSTFIYILKNFHFSHVLSAYWKKKINP